MRWELSPKQKSAVVDFSLFWGHRVLWSIWQLRCAGMIRFAVGSSYMGSHTHGKPLDTLTLVKLGSSGLPKHPLPGKLEHVNTCPGRSSGTIAVGSWVITPDGLPWIGWRPKKAHAQFIIRPSLGFEAQNWGFLPRVEEENSWELSTATWAK